MKFDTARALDLIETFDAARATAVFERAGFQVERVEVVGSPLARDVRLALTWGLFGACFPAGLFAGPGVASMPVRVGMMALGLAWFRVVPAVLARVRLPGRGVRSENLTAFRPASLDAPVRVVFVTSLDPTPPVLPGRVRRIGSAVLGLLAAVVLGMNLAGHALPRAVVVAVVGAFDVALVISLIGRMPPRSRDGRADNRDGLATLLEMARGWPKRTDERIEARFVAAGGQALDLAGLRALVAAVRADRPGKPTLVIGLWSPGLGPPFHLAGNGPSAIGPMESAADDLWVPHRLSSGGAILRDLWPFGTADPDFVAVVGGEAPAVRPESLGLAAQLATEIALRWAKRAAAPGQGGDSLARSSQNPG